MNVVFRINGREAIPVRAIPYMAETTVSADILVRGLLSVDPIKPLHGLSAYELLDYGVCRKVSPWEWHRFAIKLQALADGLHRQENNRELTEAEATTKWKQESVKILPAKVFLWKDEFAAEHLRRYRRLSNKELTENRANWIERMKELIYSPDDSYTAELMAANGMPENWRAVLQDSIDERAAEEPFNPEQFFVYAPNWSSLNANDTPTDVTYDPMIDQDEIAVVVDGFAAFVTGNQTSENAAMTHAEEGGELVRILGKWFDKPLSDLPEKQRRYADIYVPKWPELSAVERRTCAIEADRKAQETIALRFQQAHREQEGLVSDRFARRAMRDGYNGVAGRNLVEDHPQSRFEKVNLSDEQCIELARKDALTIRDWRALTGFGRGWAVAYLITSDGVFFRKWTPEDKLGLSDDDQDEMDDDNLTDSLLFPCTPAELLNFVDTAPHELAGFDVPEAFRLALTGNVQTTERAARVSGDVAKSNDSAVLISPENDEGLELMASPTGDPEQTDNAALPPKRQTDAQIATLFDCVKVAQLEAMFPDEGKWASYAERAKRNGLIAARSPAGAAFNPYLAALWWFQRGPTGWKWERCERVLANNLPRRSRDEKHLFTGELE